MLKKNYQIAGFAAICILINYGFKVLTSIVSIPLWLDSVGTAIAAYVLGPIAGAIVGATVNIAYGIKDPLSLMYAITSIAVGLSIGICSRKKMMESFFNTLTASTVVTFVATVISTIINWIFYNGSTGNEWGDGILRMLQEWNVNRVISAFAAEFFLDFLDKFITMILLYLLIRIGRKYCSRKKESDESNVDSKDSSKKSTATIASILAVTLILGNTVLFSAEAVYAASYSEPINYSKYIQTIYSNDNGLLSGEANDIAATDDGVLWIGTYAGLFRFSGNGFKYMNEFESVKNVNCLYTDIEGRLWIGTNDDGLSICINEKITETFDKENGFPSNSVRSIVQASTGNYFVGTSADLALVSLVGGSNIIKTFPEIYYAQDLSADGDGHIAAITATGELFLLTEDKVLDKLDGLNGELFTGCEFLDNGNLLVGTDAGHIYIFRLFRNGLDYVEAINVDNLIWINSINQIENKDIFVCADNGIGWIDSRMKFHYINTGNFNSSIDQMIMDYQGGLWFCSSRLGIMKLASSAFNEVFSEASLESRVVNSITEWNGLLYFGTDSGLSIVEKGTLKTVKNNLSDMFDQSRVRCLFVDSQNRLWIFDYKNGITCVDSNGSTTVYNSDQGAIGSKFRSGLELSDGSIAASSERGVSIVKDGVVVNTIGHADGLENELVLCMLQTADGRLLAGTDGGGIAVIENGKITKTLSKKDGLGSDVILRMVHEEGNDNIFIVTSNGICYLDANDNIRELSNFPYSNNYDIYDSGTGLLYVTGSAGIYIVSKDELLSGNKDLYYENLNYLSGLRGTFTANAWNYVDDSGNWYIAGGSGVTKYDLSDSMFGKSGSYRMSIKSITVDNVVYELNGENTYSLDRGVSAVQLQPEIINYSSSEPYVSYYLEGKDTEKTVVLQSALDTILYTGLNSGTYLFHLAIQDGPDGNVTEEQIFTLVKAAEINDYVWFKAYFFAELIFIAIWFTWFITKKANMRTVALQEREIALARDQVRMGNETILAIARTVDAKDSYTSDHSSRVAKYSVRIASEMGYSENDIESLRKSALLHDIGKIGIPDAVLNKPGRLTDEEYEIMKSHVTRGGEILKDLTIIPNVKEGALYHHERYDGRGYAGGLKGTDIPETARIIAIADAFDAMTGNRVYRKRLSMDVVLSELKKGRGTQFDPHIADIMIRLVESGEINPFEEQKAEEEE